MRLAPLKRWLDAIDCLRSSRWLANGGNSIGEGPVWGERPDTEEVSEIKEGAPSAENCEKADGEGNGVSNNPECRLYIGPALDGTLMCCGRWEEG